MSHVFLNPPACSLAVSGEMEFIFPSYHTWLTTRATTSLSPVSFLLLLLHLDLKHRLPPYGVFLITVCRRGRGPLLQTADPADAQSTSLAEEQIVAPRSHRFHVILLGFSFPSTSRLNAQRMP